MCASVHNSFIQYEPKNRNNTLSITLSWLTNYGIQCTLLSIKRHHLIIHKTTWFILSNIMLNERSQTQKSIYCMILCLWNFRKDVFNLQWYKVDQCSPGTGVGLGLASKQLTGALGAMEIFLTDCGMITQSCTYQNSPSLHLKTVKRKVWLKKT